MHKSKLRRDSQSLRICPSVIILQRRDSTSRAHSSDVDMVVAREALLCSVFQAPPVKMRSKAPSFRGLYFVGSGSGSGGAVLNMRVVQPKFRVRAENMFFLHRAGAVVLDVAPSAANGPGFDFTKKVSFFLNPPDIMRLATWQAKDELNISKRSADQGASSTEAAAPLRDLTLRPMSGGTSYKLTIATATPAAGGNNGNDGSTVGTIVLSTADVAMIRHLATQSLTWTTGWAMNLDPSTFDPAQHTAYEGGVAGGVSDDHALA